MPFMIAFLIALSMAFITAFITLACHAEATTPPTVTAAHDPALRHHDVRPDRLAPPFATKSAGNPPLVWSRPANAALHLPPGFRIELWATKLSNPRFMILAPNGDVFVSEPGAGRIDVFRDTGHTGHPDHQFTFASGLDEPYGLAFHGGFLYVGDEDAVVRFPYAPGQTAARGAAQHVTSLPPGGHSTRGVIFRRDGAKMYVSIGSASNVSAEEPPRAAIMEYNPDGSGRRVLAFGLRNPVGMAWNPTTGALWTAVNERDGLGDDLVPDYITEVTDGAFYGWPYSYIGRNLEPRRKGEHPELVAKAIVPSLLIESHSAPLGIAFYDGTMFPAEYRGNAFVALHGSWNRTQRTGYKIISVPFRGGKPAGGYDDFIVGWSPDPDSRRVWGRPVGLLVLPDGSMLISDDGAGVIWRVTYRAGS
jgi:glucose/arabinose dehydrogenase